MPHDEDLILQRDELPERFRLHTRLHSCILRGLLTLSAVISNSMAVLDYRLVAAAGKRKVYCHPCKIITLRIGLPAHSKSDT